jgi:uncharacterized protein (TIGR02246 family)
VRKLPTILATASLLGLAVAAASAAAQEKVPAPAEDAKPASPEEKALRKRAETFIAAFNDGDAKALAAFWLPDGDYVDATGHTLSGRKAIEAAFGKQFAQEKGAKLRITSKSLRFVKPDLAIEDGETEVLHPGDVPPTATHYTAVHVNQGGEWYLASVRDTVAMPPASNEHLQELDWLAGDWVGEAEKGPVAQATYARAQGDNWLVGTLITAHKDVPVAGATQWIGWDAAAKHVRSWSFDSGGGFSEGAWARDGDKWTAQMTTTTPEGKKLTATNVVTRVDADHFTWQSTKRALDGKPIPDTDVIKMKRAK